MYIIGERLSKHNLLLISKTDKDEIMLEKSWQVKVHKCGI